MVPMPMASAASVLHVVSYEQNPARPSLKRILDRLMAAVEPAIKAARDVAKAVPGHNVNVRQAVGFCGPFVPCDFFGRPRRFGVVFLPPRAVVSVDCICVRELSECGVNGDDCATSLPSLFAGVATLLVGKAWPAGGDNDDGPDAKGADFSSPCLPKISHRPCSMKWIAKSVATPYRICPGLTLPTCELLKFAIALRSIVLLRIK